LTEVGIQDKYFIRIQCNMKAVLQISVVSSGWQRNTFFCNKWWSKPTIFIL